MYAQKELSLIGSAELMLQKREEEQAQMKAKAIARKRKNPKRKIKTTGREGKGITRWPPS
jgi:hypothetical protein